MDYEVLDVAMPQNLRRSKYPWKSMRVGQCFIERDPEGLQRLRSAASQFNKRNEMGWKMSVRQLDDGTIGVWRVA